DAFIIVENICCQGSVFGYEFYFRSKGQRKKSSFLTAMTKTGDLSCLYCDLFEKNILPCPFIEAADSAISLQAQQNRYYRTQKRLL
ncbi:hypothetical protein, partial [Blautia wexlerae]